MNFWGRPWETRKTPHNNYSFGFTVVTQNKQYELFQYAWINQGHQRNQGRRNQAERGGESRERAERESREREAKKKERIAQRAQEFHFFFKKSF